MVIKVFKKHSKPYMYISNCSAETSSPDSSANLLAIDVAHFVIIQNPRLHQILLYIWRKHLSHLWNKNVQFV